MVATRRYEEQQARWRHEVLGLPAGPPTHPTSRRPTVAHCLPRAHDGVTAEEAGWNLVSEAARSFARLRTRGPGLVMEDRLWRNMLSSQPLAFSVVGELRAHPAAAASLLGRLTGLSVVDLGLLGDPHDDHVLDGLDAEWAPPRNHHTGDRSGFDIAAIVVTDDDRRVLLSVEVKYTDTFSTGFRGHELDRKCDQHRPHLAALGIDEQCGRGLLGTTATCQFLRSVMITDSVVRQGLRGEGHLDGGIAVVLALDEDGTARNAVERVGRAVNTPRLRTAFWSHESLLDHAAGDPALADWAETMRRRYLLGAR